ncbi:MAG: HEPN domain-containing protein [candidate division Zixibacteria bacterium]|nr:HEPN domain-containing protein [candidate division Zixibacteria bacterium]
MTNEEMATSALNLAARILGEAKRYRKDGASSLTIRRSQEVVEPALKGVLRFLGLEVPRVHDVSGFFHRHRDRLPPHIAENLDRITRISRTLREEREISFYGDEEAGFTPDELYTEEDAEKAISDATFIFDLCAQVIKRK